MPQDFCLSKLESYAWPGVGKAKQWKVRSRNFSRKRTARTKSKFRRTRLKRAASEACCCYRARASKNNCNPAKVRATANNSSKHWPISMHSSPNSPLTQNESSRSAAAEILATRCCIVGGGPAGMLCGFLLARAGIDVVVLEKHADFLRDFRGDTIHPSTLELMHELCILYEFLARPHQEVRQLTGRVAGESVTFADFTHLPTRCKFLVLMPQWEFLDFLAGKAGGLDTFELRMETEVAGLIEEDGRIAGVRVKTASGPQEIRADLVVGADGRRSVVREQAGLTVENLVAPIDVLWMRLSRRTDDPGQAFGY